MMPGQAGEGFLPSDGAHDGPFRKERHVDTGTIRDGGEAFEFVRRHVQRRKPAIRAVGLHSGSRSPAFKRVNSRDATTLLAMASRRPCHLPRQ
ncbi:MAG: hypothetical protein OXN90_02810 [Gemmatimonadota bacterium]|nr:hypothetical protein [Gemmatimonadota bacterium]